MIFLLAIPLALVAFVFEIYPRLINREFGVDIWTHLLYLKEYHKQKGIPRRIEKGFLVTGEYDYPPVFIWIASRFPFKLVEKYEFIFSPFFDSLHVVFIFIFAYAFTSNLALSLIAQLLYILTPIVVLENSSATPRSLGYTFFTFLMVSIFLFYRTENILWILPAVVSGSAILLTHRFTTQGFLIFAIAFSIIDRNLVFMSIFLLSFIIALVLSRGFYLKVISGHLGNLKFWKDNIKYRFAHQVKGNLKPAETKDFIFRIYTQFLKFPPFVLEITSPWTIIPLYMFLFDMPNNFILQRFIIWIVISYLLALLTMWVPKFRFLGEGQRYLELSSFPTAFIAAYFLISKLNTNLSLPISLFYIICGIGSVITIVVIQRKAIIYEKLRTVTPSMKEMFKYLKSLKNKPKLLVIPHQSTTSVIYHTNSPVFVNADYKSIEKISDVYPYIRKSIKNIMNNHALDLVLLNTDYATISDLKIKKYKIVKKIENFLLIKLNK